MIVRAHRVRIQWIPTSDMPADGFTKALPRQRHDNFVKSLNLVDIRNKIDSDEWNLIEHELVPKAIMPV
jgi:hypothetical protein